MYMKVLVLGNGFDLAHGLPTSYTNFIEFISMLDDNVENNELKKYLSSNVNCEYYCIDKIDYIGLQEKYRKFDMSECGIGIISYLKLTKNIDKWVDFEDEVLTLLKVCNEWNSIVDSQECIFSTSSKAHNTGDYVLEIFNTYDKLDNATIRKYNNCLDKLPCFTPIYKQGNINKEYIINDFEISTSKVFAVLNEALKQLEELFNWYIVNVVDCLMANKKTKLSNSAIDYVEYVINFNYTDTLRRMYNVCLSEKYYHYIHGQARKFENNILFGCNYHKEIDLKELRVFSKTFKRIFYDTEYRAVMEVEKYLEWDLKQVINSSGSNTPFDPQTTSSGEIGIYFWGHSLSTSDSDNIINIFNMAKKLEDLYAHVSITILYHEEKSKFDMLNNLFEIFGQDYIEEYTSSSRLYFEDLEHYPIEIND